MTTSAIVGTFTFKRQHASGSPITYVEIPEVISVSGIGVVNDLVDATHFSSGGSREYIAGLADGQEITIECNYVPNSVQQGAFMAAVEAKDPSGNFQFLVGSSPNETYTFAAVYISYVVNPAVDDRDTITFVIKVTGAITRA